MDEICDDIIGGLGSGAGALDAEGLPPVSKGSESLAPGCVLTERGIQRGYEYKVWISGEYRRPCMDVYLFIYYIYTDLYV